MTYNSELLQVLCPFGNWTHSKGMQIVDEIAAEKMTRNSEKILSRKIPIYMGHPDDNPSRLKLSPVGFVKKICQTKGGIAVVSRYAKDAFEKIRAGKIRAMSPRWQMELLSDGTYRPIRLISIGLTNNPNIPDSGRIIKVENNSDALNSTKRSIALLEEKTRCLENATRECSRKAQEIENTAKAVAVSTRVESGKQKNREKNFNHAISAIALERSKRLGLPYTKCFAALRKEMERDNELTNKEK